jgi:hypothetical protein
MKPDDQLITATVEQFRQISGLGTTKIWELIRDGTLETVTFGKRRLIVVEATGRPSRDSSAPRGATPGETEVALYRRSDPSGSARRPRSHYGGQRPAARSQRASRGKRKSSRGTRFR